MISLYGCIAIQLLPVCFGHALRPCAARTRLFSHTNMQNGVPPPSPRPFQLRCHSLQRKSANVFYLFSFMKAVPRAARTNGGGCVAARPAGERAGASPHHARLLQSTASRGPNKFCKIFIFYYRQILKFQSHNCVPKLYTKCCEKNLWRMYGISPKFLIRKFP